MDWSSIGSAIGQALGLPVGTPVQYPGMTPDQAQQYQTIQRGAALRSLIPAALGFLATTASTPRYMGRGAALTRGAAEGMDAYNNAYNADLMAPMQFAKQAALLRHQQFQEHIASENADSHQQLANAATERANQYGRYVQSNIARNGPTGQDQFASLRGAGVLDPRIAKLVPSVEASLKMSQAESDRIWNRIIATDGMLARSSKQPAVDFLQHPVTNPDGTVSWKAYPYYRTGPNAGKLGASIDLGGVPPHAGAGATHLTIGDREASQIRSEIYSTALSEHNETIRSITAKGGTYDPDTGYATYTDLTPGPNAGKPVHVKVPSVPDLRKKVAAEFGVNLDGSPLKASSTEPPTPSATVSAAAKAGTPTAPPSATSDPGWLSNAPSSLKISKFGNVTLDRKASLEHGRPVYRTSAGKLIWDTAKK